MVFIGVGPLIGSVGVSPPIGLDGVSPLIGLVGVNPLIGSVGVSSPVVFPVTKSCPSVTEEIETSEIGCKK